MSRSIDALLDRVRKLLALATSSNVHEAALAASRAQALIQTHRLQALLDAESDAEAADAADPITDGRDTPLETSKRLRRWKIVLATGLAQANGCVAYTSPAGRLSHLLIAGRSADRAAVTALYAWLVNQLAWLSATHGPGRPKRWHDDFRVGASQSVLQRLQSTNAEPPAGFAPEALVRVGSALEAREAAVHDFAEQRLGLKKGRAVMVDLAAWEAGRAAGEAVPLPGSGSNV